MFKRFWKVDPMLKLKNRVARMRKFLELEPPAPHSVILQEQVLIERAVAELEAERKS